MTLPDATFDVYFASDDQIIECTACDPDAGPPEDWPSWTDDGRYAIGPAYHPSESDSCWVAQQPAPISGGAPFEPTDADWDELARWADHLDRVDELRREDDHRDEARARFG